MITIRIAELNIGVHFRYPFTEEYISAYAVDGEPDFTVEATDEDLLREAEFAEEPTEKEYLEYVAVYRKIAEKLPEYDGVVFHGAVLELDKKAYMICARSGVGKTTHINLWKQAFGDRVSVLNGDKPVLRVIDGVVYACGTPYNGKEGMGKRGTLPLSGIAFLTRDAENSYSKITVYDALERFMGQIYINNLDGMSALRTLRLADKILSDTPLFEFRCNMDVSAAEMAERAFLEEN